MDWYRISAISYPDILIGVTLSQPFATSEITHIQLSNSTRAISPCYFEVNSEEHVTS